MTSGVPIQRTHLDCVVYTSNTRITGKFQTTHSRVSDALNLPDADFLVLQAVSVRSLFSDEDDEMNAASVMLRRNNAIVVSLAEQATDGERPVLLSTRMERSLQDTMLEVGPFTVTGTVHLPAGAELLSYVAEPSAPFLALTNAKITFRPDPSSNFTAPFVMVSRQWIRAILEGAEHATPEWRTARERVGMSGVDAAPVRADHANGFTKEAAEVLLASQVFSGADIATLEQALGELSANGSVSRKQFYPGSEVFREGDYGDSLFVVGNGSLEVVARDSAVGGVRRVAELKEGDVFGEVALLGEGRRTASVIGTTSGTIYEIKEQALKQLVSLFPSATTSLLRVMVQRRGPRGGPVRSLV